MDSTMVLFQLKMNEINEIVFFSGNLNLPFSCFHCCCFLSINRVLYKSFWELSFCFTEGGSGGLLVEE
jgi:hypothetical protein